MPETLKGDARVVAAWSFYDFANSAFNTLVTTFIYSTYFTQAIAPNDTLGTDQWSHAVVVSSLLIAVLSPIMGALADRGGYRKRMLFFTTVITVLGTTALYFPQQGDVLLALFLFVIANTAFELCFVFYNAFLPDIAPPSKIGRISGYGWALGFVGGLGSLAVGYALLVAPEQPLFGFSKETGANIRATNLLVAAWFAVFSIPAFLYLPSRPVPRDLRPKRLVRSSFRELARTFHEVRRYRQIVRLLVARLFYNDGLITIITFGGIYAANVLGFTFNEIFLFGIVLNVAAGLGALVFGFLDDRLGGKPTILLTIVGLAAGTVLALFAQSKTGLWVAGGVIGIFMGPNQAASRSLLGRFLPRGKESEFYGFYSFSGKATAFMGPFLFGQLTLLFGTQRAGVASVLLFFLIGGLLLLMVDEREGKSAVERALDTPPAEV